MRCDPLPYCSNGHALRFAGRALLLQRREQGALASFYANVRQHVFHRYRPVFERGESFAVIAKLAAREK